MKRVWLLSCAAALAAAQFFPGHAAAQAGLRVKARLIAFDGDKLVLQPLSPVPLLPPKPGAPADPKPDVKPDAKDAKVAPEPLHVTVLPDTRYVVTEKSSFAALKTGGYAGALVTQSRNGRLRAKEVYLYADALRGTGEGRFRDGEALRVNGAVSAVTFASPDDHEDGTMTLHYRGAAVSPLGAGRTVCEGRATPPAVASALACSGDAAIEVPPGTPVSALAVGDKSLLVPGVTVSVALARGDAGEQVTPGVVVEKPPVAETAPVEKPQSSP